MPSMDRNWRWMYGFAFCAGAQLALIPLSSVIVGVFMHITPLTMLGMLLNGVTWADLVMMAVWLILASFVFGAGRRAQQRQHQRTLALAGEMDALLPARVAPLPAARRAEMLAEVDARQ